MQRHDPGDAAPTASGTEATEADEEAAALTGRVLARVGADPFFVGSALVAYQRASGADVAGLATFLGCPLAALPRLALARRPEPGAPRFLGETARLAARVGAAEDRLAALLGFYPDHDPDQDGGAAP
jgi:hypothetical protein